MDYPASMRRAREVAIVAGFSALIVGSNFALAEIPNVKLLDTLVFVSAFLFGFRIGASVAVVSELTWSFVSPWGIAGPITPFLVVGELIYSAAGWAASKVWGGDVRPISKRNLFIGSILAISAFIWDVETNLGTALLAFWPNITLSKIAATELYGAPFMLFHELSDFMLGALVAPVIILLLARVSKSGLRQAAAGSRVKVGA
jgi:hypothetical protein